jgi:hypothetical protein
MKNEEMMKKRVCLESHCVYGNPVRGDHDTHDLLQYRRYVFYRKIGGQRTGGGSFCGISGIFNYRLFFQLIVAFPTYSCYYKDKTRVKQSADRHRIVG